MKTVNLIMVLLFLTGCAGHGSVQWYKRRVSQIDYAYRNKAITTKEYRCLQDEAEKIRFHDIPRLASVNCKK